MKVGCAASWTPAPAQHTKVQRLGTVKTEKRRDCLESKLNRTQCSEQKKNSCESHSAYAHEDGVRSQRKLPRTVFSVRGSQASQAARKPNFVLGDHSSRRRITAPLQQPTRKFRHCTLPLGASGRYAPAARKRATGLPAYLVLLRVGFTMRCRLLDARCALTAPFHPYPACLRKRGGIFSVALAVFTP